MATELQQALDAAVAEFLAKGGRIVRIEAVVEPDRALTVQPMERGEELWECPAEPEPSADD